VTLAEASGAALIGFNVRAHKEGRQLAEQEGLEIAFIVTDEDRLFESVIRQLPDQVEPVRLYQAYLRNFEIESGRGLR